MCSCRSATPSTLHTSHKSILNSPETAHTQTNKSNTIRWFWAKKHISHFGVCVCLVFLPACPGHAPPPMWSRPWGLHTEREWASVCLVCSAVGGTMTERRTMVENVILTDKLLVNVSVRLAYRANTRMPSVSWRRCWKTSMRWVNDTILQYPFVVDGTDTLINRGHGMLVDLRKQRMVAI